MVPNKPKTARRSFSKFIRHPECYPLQLQERDLEILNLVYDYRFIASDQATSIIPGSERKILQRLQKLFHHGYLERLADRRIRTHSGSDKMVYSITGQAAELLTAELGLPVGKVNWASKNRSVTDRHIEHALMIGRFRSIVSLATQGRPDLSLEFWKESRGTGQNIDPELSDTVMVPTEKRGKERLRVVPDAFLALDASKKKHFLYLEADRSTMTNDRFLQKLKAYWTWWKQGGSKRKHSVEHFRVLTITRSYQRRDNLRRAAIEASSGAGGSGMFWFACEKDYSVSAPESIWGNIWITAKSQERHSLIG